MKFTRRVAVRGIIFNDGKIFAVKQKDAEGMPVDYWCTPGGGLNDGESIRDGLYREMIEETGIAPTIGRLLLIQQFFAGGKEQLEFFFHIENAEDYATIDLTSTSHGELEIADCDFIAADKERLLPEILQSLDLDEYTRDTKPTVMMYYEKI